MQDPSPSSGSEYKGWLRCEVDSRDLVENAVKRSVVNEGAAVGPPGHESKSMSIDRVWDSCIVL